MDRKLRLLALVFSALMTMSGVAASTAFAEGELFNSTVEPTTLTGSSIGSQDFEISIGLFECKQVSFKSTMAKKTASEVKVVPTYTECERIVGMEKAPARVTMTSCYYVFTSSIPAGKKQAPIHIECATAGDGIDLEYETLGKWRPCVDIPAQTPTGGTTYAANGNHLDVTAAVTGTAYSLTGLCGGGVGTGAAYSGKITVKGTDNNNNEATLTWQ